MLVEMQFISFDTEDVEENNLTAEKAQQLCLKYARKNFLRLLKLVVTHIDGDDHSGNIHTNIVQQNDGTEE